MKRGLHIDTALHHIANRPRRHSHARHREVGNVDDVRAGFSQERSARDEFVSREFRAADPFQRR